MNLGAGTTLSNAGTFSPGDTGTAQVTTLTGDFVQTGNRHLRRRRRRRRRTESDRINVSGTAAFAGAILPNIIALTSQTGQLTIATATALTSTATVDRRRRLRLLAAGPGRQHAVAVMGLMSSPHSILALLANANANQRAIAIYLDTLNAAGPTAAQQALIDALLALGETELIAAINQLTPELYSDAQISSLYASLGFANSLLSCKVNGAGTASIVHEGQCLWAGANATFLEPAPPRSKSASPRERGQFAAGAQVALDEVWRLRLRRQLPAELAETATNATSEGDAGQAGVALKYNTGPFLAAASLSGGRGWYDTMRPVASPALPARRSATPPSTC